MADKQTRTGEEVTWHVLAIRRGIEAADHGELIDHDVIEARYLTRLDNGVDRSGDYRPE